MVKVRVRNGTEGIFGQVFTNSNPDPNPSTNLNDHSSQKKAGRQKSIPVV
jgi:hypothetical protein